MKKTIYSALLLGALALPAAAATVWTGSGDGTSFFQEANWDNGSGAPAAGAIDPSTALAVDSYTVTGTSLTNIGALTLGNAATSLTLDGSTITSFNTESVIGAGSLSLLNGSGFTTQFIGINLLVNIDATSSLSLKGGGGPISGGATINLAGGGVINFLAESVADATTEHLGSITINGAALVLGTNATLVSDGGAGSILTATAVPEPSSTALLGLGGLTLILRRRK